MIKLIICLVILLLFWYLLFNTINAICIGENIDIQYSKILGSRFDGIKLGQRLGLPTVNIYTDTAMECGIYEANSHHGPVTIIVGKNDKKKAFVNFMTYTKDMDTIIRFEFWNVKRIVNKDSDFVNTFNKGCCLCKN